MEDKPKPPEAPEPMETSDEEDRRDSNELVIDEDQVAGLKAVAQADSKEPQPNPPPAPSPEPERMDETETQEPVDPEVPKVPQHLDSDDEDLLPIPSQDETPEPPPRPTRGNEAGPSVPHVQTVLSRGTGSRILAKERETNDATHAYDPEHPANALRLRIQQLIHDRNVEHDAGREKSLDAAEKELLTKPIKEWTFRRGFKAKSKANVTEFEFSKKLTKANKDRKELLERHNVKGRGPYNTQQLTREVLHNPNLARHEEAKKKIEEALKESKKLRDLPAPIHPVTSARQTFFPRHYGFEGTKEQTHQVKAKVDTNLAGSRAAGLDYIGSIKRGMKKSKSKSLGNLPPPPPTPAVNIPKSPPNRGRTPKRKKNVPQSPSSPQQGKEKQHHIDTIPSGASSSATEDVKQDQFIMQRVIDPLKDDYIKCTLRESMNYLREVKKKIEEMKPNTWLLRFKGNPFQHNFQPQISEEIQGQLDDLEEIGDDDTLDAFNALLGDMITLTLQDSGRERFGNTEVMKMQGGVNFTRKFDWKLECNYIDTIFIGKLKKGIELPSLNLCQFVRGRIAEENEQGIMLIREDMIPEDQLDDFADFIGQPWNEMWTSVEGQQLSYRDGLSFAHTACINHSAFDALLVKVIGRIGVRTKFHKVLTYSDFACLLHQHRHAGFSNVDDQSLYSEFRRRVYREDGVPVDRIYIPMHINDTYSSFMIMVTPSNSTIDIFSASQPNVKFSEYIRKDVTESKRVEDELGFLKKLMESLFYRKFNEQDPKWPSDSLFAVEPAIATTTNRTEGMYTAILCAELSAYGDESKDFVLEHSVFSDTLPLPLTDPRCYYLKLMNGTLPDTD